MPEGKGRDELRNVPKPSQKEHYAQKKQEMVISCQHVTGTETDISRIATAQHRGSVRGGDSMCLGCLSHNQ